ncbi:MAG: SDR family NAD(P)-dependent oxidoreductase [Granulosicoccaceae bacterium]
MSEFTRTNLNDKHVVISGGGSGVGAEIAAQFAKNGASVSILGRRESALETVAAKTGAMSIVCDVTDSVSVESAINSARNKYGPISIAVANAGAAISKPFSAMTPEDFSNMLDVNALGVFNLWQVCLNDMRELKWGRMLAIASSAGLKGYPYVSGYCAAKHAVVGLTRALALELPQTGITVNAVCPGFVDTPMLDESIKNIVTSTGKTAEDAANILASNNPMKRFITTEEVASTVMWLASNDSGSINGQAVSVNGGEV